MKSFMPIWLADDSRFWETSASIYLEWCSPQGNSTWKRSIVKKVDSQPRKNSCLQSQGSEHMFSSDVTLHCLGEQFLRPRILIFLSELSKTEPGFFQQQNLTKFTLQEFANHYYSCLQWSKRDWIWIRTWFGCLKNRQTSALESFEETVQLFVRQGTLITVWPAIPWSEDRKMTPDFQGPRKWRLSNAPFSRILHWSVPMCQYRHHHRRCHWVQRAVDTNVSKMASFFSSASDFYKKWLQDLPICTVCSNTVCPNIRCARQTIPTLQPLSICQVIRTMYHGMAQRAVSAIVLSKSEK